MIKFDVWWSFSYCMYVRMNDTYRLLLLHSWERAGHLNRYTCWVLNRSHRHKNSCKLLERGRGRGQWLVQTFFMSSAIYEITNRNRIIPRLFVILPSGLCGIILKRMQGWRNLRTIHWFPPGRVFQPGQQYEWKREPHTLGLTETRKKDYEQTNLLLTQASQTYLSKTPKQIHKDTSYALSCPRAAWPLLSE